MTETDEESCFGDPLGCAERVFWFVVMFGAIKDVSGVKVGHYPDS